MNIAVDVRSLMEGRMSGVEEYTIQILKAMTGLSENHAWQVFYNSLKAVDLPALGEGVEVKSFSYPNKVFNIAQYALGWPRWDRLVAADVFFVPNMRLMPLGSATPLVVTAHDLSFERFPEFYSRQRRLWHRLVRARQLMLNADHIIAVSQSTKDDVVSLYGIDEERVSVVASGVPADWTVPNVLEVGRVRQKYDLPERFVLYLGTLEPRKNIPGLIEAFSSIAGSVPHDLVIAGAEGWLMADIEQAMRVSPVRSRIQRVGFVAEADKRALYAAADLFVYPSFYEGFGFPPLEALLSGTPVITSRNSSLPEIVGEWTTLIEPRDVAELALVMQELLTDPGQVPAEVAREIKQRYSWDRAARRTLDIITSVV